MNTIFPGDFEDLLSGFSPTKRVMDVEYENPLLSAISDLTTEDSYPLVIIPMRRNDAKPPSGIQPPNFSEMRGMIPNYVASKVTVKKLDPKTGKLETIMDSGDGDESLLDEGVIPEPIKDVIKTTKNTSNKLNKKDK